MNLKKFNLQGEEVGEVKLDPGFLDIEASHQMIKDYVVALRANARQWSANTKGRSEINHSNKKPWKQKGTGNARQGTFAAPQFKGGGVVFGPKPKFDQHVRINRKERRLAIRYLVADKIKNNAVIFVEDAVFNATLAAPSTKSVAAFLKKQGALGRSVLFLKEVHDEADSESAVFFKKSVRNLPKSRCALALNVNGYELLAAHKIVMSESALADLVSLLT